MFEIDKSVKFQQKHGSRKFPFPDMEVGDSFYVELDTFANARSAASNWGKFNGGRKFSGKKHGDGGRIWRIA